MKFKTGNIDHCLHPNTHTGTLTNAWNALHRYLPDSLFEAGEAGVHLPDLALLPLNQLLDDLQHTHACTHDAQALHPHGSIWS